MNDEAFEKAISRTQRIAEVVGKLPAELQSQAFSALVAFIQQGEKRTASAPAAPTPKGDAQTNSQDPPEGEDREAFFGRFTHDKPHENVRLLIAWLYSQYGTEPFTLAELKDLATEIGLTVPERLDMTIKQAREENKVLFTGLGKGKYKPTVHGEASLKSEYGIKKGTLKRPSAVE